ncbi:MAG: TlpA family protein disulfide reductase [Desulfobulbaceae bacterium]|nr:TlpA family protein disulfide reductase [Desulfobulbaceae bacterium]
MVNKGLRICSLLWCFFIFYGESQGAVTMPSFSLPTAIDGTVVTSESYQGKALLITFFATWCSSCLHEIKSLKALQAKFQGQGFAVVALSVDEGRAGAVLQLVKKADINYQVLMADQATAQKFGGVIAIPTSFLVNKNGHVVKKYPGSVPPGVLERDIESTL